MSEWIPLGERDVTSGPSGGPAPAAATLSAIRKDAGASRSPSANGWCDGLLSLGCDCPWEESGYGYATVRTTHCGHSERCLFGGATRSSVEAELDYAEMLA